MQPEELFVLLDAWVERGWLRALDRAFARFLHQIKPDDAGFVLLTAALVSHQLGRGHICLDIDAALIDPDATLLLPPEGQVGEDLPDKPSVLLRGKTRALWEADLRGSSLVGFGAGNTPLVLDGGRIYLRRYWQYEQAVAQRIRHRVACSLTAPDNLFVMLDTLFASLRTEGETRRKDVHWQSVAAAIAARSRFCVISGGPGTGKTTTVVKLLELLQGLALDVGRKLRIRLAAPTGKAAARLTESIGSALDQLPDKVRGEVPTEVTTLHRLLGSRPDTRGFLHHRQNPLHVDLLVVDEASMIDLEMMSALLGALPESARLILLGDKDQLASVEAGSVLGDLCRDSERPGYLPETVHWIEKNTGYSLEGFAGEGTHLDQHIVILRKSHRFGETSGIGSLARAVNVGDRRGVRAVWKKNFGDISRLAVKSIWDTNFVHLVLDGNAAGFPGDKTGGEPVGYRTYLQLVKDGPRAGQSEAAWMKAVLDAFGRFQIIAALRKGDWGVDGLNDRTAAILYRAGLVRSRDGWYPGRPVLITRNDYTLGLMNGDIGILLPVSNADPDRERLRVVFPMADGTLKKVLPSRLNDVETVYAMTVHKSQGSEFEHTAMVLPESMSPVLTRELIYTGITRARNWFTLVSPRLDLLEKSVKRRTHRASGLGDLLGIF